MGDGARQIGERILKRGEKNFGVDIYILLTVMIVFSMYIHVKTYLIMYFKYEISYMSIVSQWSQNKKKKVLWEKGRV